MKKLDYPYSPRLDYAYSFHLVLKQSYFTHFRNRNKAKKKIEVHLELDGKIVEMTYKEFKERLLK